MSYIYGHIWFVMCFHASGVTVLVLWSAVLVVAGSFFCLFFIVQPLLCSVFLQVESPGAALKESDIGAVLNDLRAQLAKSETGRKLLESLLSEANGSVALLRGEGSREVLGVRALKPALDI